MKNNKIKIIHVISTLNVGGIESTVIGLCNKMDAFKYDISIMVMSGSSLKLINRINPNINIITLPHVFHNSSIIDTGLLVLYMPKIALIFKKMKPDIIHTHIFQYNVMPVLLSIYLSVKRSKHFHTIHASGIHYERRTRKHKRKLYLESYFYKLLNTNIVCISKIVHSNLINYLSGYSSVRIIPNGVDTKIFNRSLFMQTTTNKFDLVYVSRLETGKNHLTLLKAMDILIPKYSDIYLRLVGDGKLRNELENYAETHNLNGNVEFLGNKSNIAKILANSQVGVFPSEHEGDGVALTEMMTMGLAIIGSNIQVIRSKFVRIDDALFFNVLDHIELAKCIEKIYLDTQLLCHLQERSYENSKRFNLSTIANNYEEYYLNALKTSKEKNA